MNNADSSNRAAPAGGKPAGSLSLAYLLGIIGIAVFGATLPLTKIALIDFSPGFITFARALIATAAATIMLAILKKPLPHGHWRTLFVAGLMVVLAFPAFMALAMQRVPASHGAVVLGLLPIATAVLAAVLVGERHSTRFWLLSLAGAILVVGFAAYRSIEKEGTIAFEAGDLWLFAATLAASAGYVLLGRMSRTMPGWEAISWALLIWAPVTVAGTLWTWPVNIGEASTLGIAALVYLGLFSMLIGFFAWNAALALGGIARIGQVQLMQTFFTLALAALILGEAIDIITLGTAILVTVIVAATRKV